MNPRSEIHKLRTISRQGTLTTGYNFKTKRFWKFEGLTTELAYLIGVYFGDGCITKYTSRGFDWFKFTMRSIDEDFVDYTAGCIKGLIGYKPKTLKTSGRKGRFTYYLSIGNNDLFGWMTRISSNKSIIPEVIISVKDKLKKEFLSGLMDSDGWCAEDRSRKKFRYRVGFCGSSEWIDEIAKMFQRLGVGVGKRQTRKSEWSRRNNILYMLNTRSFVESGIRFKIARKRKRLETYRKLYM